MSLSGGQTSKQRGLKNSSITRVRPVFQQLLQKDRYGRTWLTDLLVLALRNRRSPSEVICAPGLLLKEIAETRRYSDRILQGYGVKQPIDLENCFEKRLPPPSEFLRWLIQNLGQLIRSGDKRLKNLTDDRRDFFDEDKPDVQRAAVDRALDKLNSLKAKESFRQWWAFEGFTEVDCYLETDKLIILIEGKRTEPLSSATMWYPKRNQIIRNLEVAREVATAKNKEYGVLLVVEDPIPFDVKKEALVGLPHLSKEEVDEISNHYLGCLTWREVCHDTGVSFSELPDTTKEVAAQLKK